MENIKNKVVDLNFSTNKNIDKIDEMPEAYIMASPLDIGLFTEYNILKENK